MSGPEPSGPERPALVVRTATESDVPAVARVHVRAWQVAYQGQVPAEVLASLDPEQRARMWLRVVGGLAHGLEVATRAEQVVGFCQLAPSRDPLAPRDVGEIFAIYVDPDHWGVGAGRALLESSLTRAIRLGYRALTLWVLASNTPARRFYERLGFAPDGESKLEERGAYALHELRYRRALERDVR